MDHGVKRRSITPIVIDRLTVRSRGKGRTGVVWMFQRRCRVGARSYLYNLLLRSLTRLTWNLILFSSGLGRRQPVSQFTAAGHQSGSAACALCCFTSFILLVTGLERSALSTPHYQPSSICGSVRHCRRRVRCFIQRRDLKHLKYDM